MKLLVDFFPVIAFFIAYKLYGIYVATGVLIIAFLMQFLADWHKNKRISNMHLTSLILVVVFGGITLVLRDEKFIQWKPTVVNWLFAGAFLFSQLFTSKTIIQRLMEKTVKLPADFWKQLNWMWIGFFLFSGIANIYVVYNFDEDTWVNFKLFGMMGLTLVFILLQGVWLHNKGAVLSEDQGEREPEDTR
jgi:intracellular septation protein